MGNAKRLTIPLSVLLLAGCSTAPVNSPWTDVTGQKRPLEVMVADRDACVKISLRIDLLDPPIEEMRAEQAKLKSCMAEKGWK